jgi:hypothetical protein
MYHVMIIFIIVSTKNLSDLESDAPIKLCINMELTTLPFLHFLQTWNFHPNWISPKLRKYGKTSPRNFFLD